jgi:predicted GNAT family acetyltransferase
LQALGQLTPTDNAVALVELGKIAVPPGFVTLMEFVCHQMSASRLAEGHADFDIQPLSEADAPDMRALAELTQPGPFHARTHQLGDFVGVRENGRLIAMAGERLKLPGFTEISAVCTHPEARGRGLAAALMRKVAKGIQARGEEMFLHVYPHNKGAISVYEKLGFRHRADLLLHVFRHRQPGETQ